MPIRANNKNAMLNPLSVTAMTLLLVLAANSAHATQLVPHRAVYDVTLDSASERSGITGMRGRIVYEFRGSACDGYTTNFRFLNQIIARGVNRLSDQQTSTYESADGQDFRFVTKTFVDGNSDRTLEGSATRIDEKLSVELTEPESAKIELENALFPTAHMSDLLARAANGERFYEKKIYDGSEDGDRVMTTTVIIGPEKEAARDDAEGFEALASKSFRNVSVAYFDEGDEGEGLPEYRISFQMYPDGITSALILDYGDFVLNGKMSDLEVFQADPC